MNISEDEDSNEERPLRQEKPAIRVNMEATEIIEEVECPGHDN